ncbi:MAG TPA: AAA family ATPase [Nocardiopsis listeri]|uniref:hypothetical protein n=1 Tax=Nocardiopsis listeri TaxID=53440 RepID=UPI001DA86A5B|nr:hypothetical protein [Nocardiopsis listeri]HJE61346.1 AAA family ATPase [Nocardiopsis listeri]
MTHQRLIIITGQEGVGKSTLVRALLRHTPQGAQIDAEDLGQINPCVMDDTFNEMLRRNVAALAENFWAFEHHNVLAASFIDTHDDYRMFRPLIPDNIEITVIQLCAAKPVRDQRRIFRHKTSSPQWRDRVDLACPEDTSLDHAADSSDYRYLRIDNDNEAVENTVHRIREAFPSIYGATEPLSTLPSDL